MKIFLQNVFVSLSVLFSCSAIIVIPAIAGEINASYFTKAPRLLGASATFNSVRVRNAKYYFNIQLPEDAGNSLALIKIAQRQGQETIKFKLADTVAYIGTNRQKKEQLAIANVRQSEDTGEITVTLENPIAPNTTFTVGLKAKENPAYDGVYLFGVTAFPQGDNPTGLYLGAGRLHFYRGGSFSY